MKKITIFGHKKPDTDSVTSAIALSYLKNKLGMNTEPRTLGDLNAETKFVLDYFHVKAPMYLNDVKLQIKDVNYRKGYLISNKSSLYQGFLSMEEKGISTIPVVDENHKLDGALAMKDIARNSISGSFTKLDTSYAHILNVLEGEEIFKFDEEIKGEIDVASFRSSTFIQNFEIHPDTILIVGNRKSIIEYAIKKHAKLLIITGGNEVEKELLDLAFQNKVNMMKTKKSSYETATHIGLSNYIKAIKYSKHLLSFDEEAEVNDLLDAVLKTRYSYYPITDKKKNCLGLLKLADLNDRVRKQVILVDHNEYEQSVDGIDEAEILEVIDHHKIGNIGTSVPINFRNMPVGSTNTILYLMYMENNIEIPKNIAGLMLSGILSDTLILKSPTTTELDKTAVTFLAKVANLNYESFGMEMFKVGSSIQGKTKEEVLYTDFKNFEIDNKKVGIGQTFTLDVDTFFQEKDAYVEMINQIARTQDYYICALFITDIIKNGSYIFFNEGAKDTLDNVFDKPDIEEGSFFPGCVSRKKQIIPNIMRVMERK